MEKGNWTKAEQLLRKALKKDTLNPEARYVYSILFFSKDCPKHNIDSAYRYALASIFDFQKSSLRQKEKMKRFPLDSFILILHRAKIDSMAFERAKTINTVTSYQFFLDHFTLAIQHDAAVELRDEVAFIVALKINTYKTFKEYMIQYPASLRKADANKRYEKLLFEDKTKDGKLRSYEKFLTEFPTTLYSREAEKSIFEISTAVGSPESFIKFIHSYPESYLRKKSEDVLYHLLHGDEHALEKMELNDSLKHSRLLENGYWIPVLKNEKYGFMDQNGIETIPPKFEIIYDDYKCGEIRTDFVITSDGIISRDEKIIYGGVIDEVTELGLGFLKVQDSTGLHIVHKSGINLLSFSIEDVKLVANSFIAYKKNSKWGLIALNGRNLLAPDFDTIYSLERVVVLEKSEKRSLKTCEQIGLLADRNQFSESMVFDDVRLIESGIYLVKNGVLEGTLNSNLEAIIPLDRQILTKTPYGYVAKKNEKFSVLGIESDIFSIAFDEIRFYENWLALKNGKEMGLYNIPTKKYVASQLDSIWFLNHLAFALKADTLNVFLSSGLRKQLPIQSDINFIKTSDQQLFFYTKDKNKKSVYDVASGTRIFQLEFDEIEYFGNSIFMITRDGKRGLVNNEGKSILPIEYSVIVVTQKNYVSLFKDKKFGLYDILQKKLIKPIFERNVIPFHDNIFVAYKDGRIGFIDIDSKPIGKFEFDEILEWNDSSALVKKNFQWMIYNWKSDVVSVNKIKDYRTVINSPEEKILIMHQENGYGVISNRHGIVIPPTFSDIINIGSDEEPFYFTEKNVEEAGIYVVIYYNKKGKLLRRQVFEKAEYDEIYCEDR